MVFQSLPPELLVVFREETRDNVQLVSQALRELEDGPTPARVSELRQEIGRRLHNVKGAAASLGFEAFASVAHAAETLIVGEEGPTVVPDTISKLFQTIAWLQDAVGQERPDPAPVLRRLVGAPSVPAERDTTPTVIVATRREAEPATQRESSDEAPSEKHTTAAGHEPFIRVSTAVLEKIVAPLMTLVTERSESRFRSERLQQLAEAVGALAQRAAVGSLDADDVASLGELAADMSRETQRLRKGARHAGQALTNLQSQVHGMRLVAMGSLEGALGLAVRDAAMRTNKEVAFVLRGAGVLVDRRILESLRAPLVHLVRNAVDHGIEPRRARADAGKPVEGLVAVSVAPRRELVDIVVEDDGAGIDAARVHDVAVERGLVAPGAATRSKPEDMLDLLIRPGFSTRKAATEVSGRGIGLDVVDRCVRALGGSMSLDSKPGRGSRFTLSIPVSMLTTRVLFVRAAERTSALPLANVELTVRVVEADVHVIDGKPCIDVEGAPALLQRLGAPAGKAGGFGGTCAVIVDTPAGKMAIVVDEILGEEEVVVRPLGPPVRHIRGIVGTTLSESGEVVVVLNPSEVHALTVSPVRAVATPRVKKRPTVLVVDDSITTRTLERHILERNGYVVRSASDGHEALSILRMHKCDLVVADVEMPNLDGVGLVRAIRADAALESIPLVLVTSLDSELDRRRGLAAGAQAYLAKGQFDQEKLLQTIRHLLSGGA